MNYKQLFANEIRVPPPSYLLEGVALGGGPFRFPNSGGCGSPTPKKTSYFPLKEPWNPLE